MQELTALEFLSKLCVAVIPFVLAYVWITVKSFIRGEFVFSGIALERDAISEGRTKISELQSGNWAVNASQVQNFSAITVAIVLLVVIFVIEKTLNVWSKAYLDIIILVIGISCLVNTFALQFWNCALDRAPAQAWLLARRKIATTLQVIGWNGLYLSVVMCVSYANTWCGMFLSIIGSIGLVVTHELKVPNPRDSSG